MRVEALPVDDRLSIPGSPDLLVMVGERLIRLGPLGRLIFERAARGASLEELLADAVALFGPASGDDAGGAIEAAVRGMVDAGLLTRVDE